jgi:hypothetical protein
VVINGVLPTVGPHATIGSISQPQNIQQYKVASMQGWGHQAGIFLPSNLHIMALSPRKHLGMAQTTILSGR